MILNKIICDLLKIKGFDLPCLQYYSQEEVVNPDIDISPYATVKEAIESGKYTKQDLYISKDILINGYCKNSDNSLAYTPVLICTCPHIWDVLEWLRSQNIYVYVFRSISVEEMYYFQIVQGSDVEHSIFQYTDFTPSYDDTLMDAIKQALMLV